MMENSSSVVGTAHDGGIVVESNKDFQQRPDIGTTTFEEEKLSD